MTLATLVAVLLTSNAFLFIMGYVCGHCLCRKCKKLAKRDSQPASVREDWQLKTMGADEQELELEKNVAYGHFGNIEGN